LGDDQPIVEATNFQDGHEGFTVPQSFASELRKEGVDVFRMRRYLPSLQDIAVLIAERDRDLSCMLINSEE
jgi:hypothetical protein